MNSDKNFWKNQSEQFDLSSDYYDRFRPSYPRELVDKIISDACLLENSKILEIGAGSGKATELFVDRGFDMFCVEPGKNLVEKGLKRFSSTNKVKYYNGRFEDWDELKDYFDLAISAQAFHWVQKPLGFEKCASSLKANGYIGLFWNLYITYNEPIDNELDKTGMIFLQSEEECENRIKSHIEEINSSGCFKESKTYRFPWSKKYSTDEYIGFMKTGNQYLSASETERQQAEDKVRAIIDSYGGFITRHYLCVLFLAQKK